MSTVQTVNVIRRRKPNRFVVRAAQAPATGFDPYLADFLEHNAARGYSPRTLEGHAHSVRSFVEWCAQRSLERPQDVTRPILERYRRHLYHFRQEGGEPLSFSTQLQKLGSLKVFFRYLTRQNLILSNPASELELPRTHRKLPAQLLTRGEVEAVLAQTAIHGDIGIRDRAILETFYSTGIRRFELIGLKLYDLDLRNGTLRVCQGKGKKDRYIPIGGRARLWLRRYLEDIRPRLAMEPDEGYLFLHEYGEAFTVSRVGDLTKKYLLAAGIDKPGSCHLFRHAMATHMLENGADIRFIQVILGHAQLTTTEIYTHVTIAKLKEIHALTHPAERVAAPRKTIETAEAAALFDALAAEDDEAEQSNDTGMSE